ncbi:MAG: DinB family protein [Bacteroidia bacterium]|nr:DinB family protein [Bacteroidia bacterium]
MNQTEAILELWLESRTRLTNQFAQITAADLLKRLHPQSNSIGFLLKHIGEVEQLFARNVFGLDIKGTVETLGVGKDKSQYTNLQELLAYLANSHTYLEQAINNVLPDEWNEEITTKEFGTRTKAQAIGRITSHTAYHAGQIGIILKYGKI